MDQAKKGMSESVKGVGLHPAGSDKIELLRALEHAKVTNDFVVLASALENLAEASKQVEAGVEFGKAGGCKSVVEVLSAWGTGQRGIAGNGLNAIRFLALKNPANQMLLLKTEGILDAVVNAVCMFARDDARVAWHGCAVIAWFADNNPFITMRLVELGACKGVTDALISFGSSDAGVAQCGCKAAGKLAYSNWETSKKLGNLGACRVIVAALEAFGKTDFNVSAEGCFAVYSLARFDENNKQTFLDAGGLEAVQACMENHGDKSDALTALGVVLEE